MRKIYSFLPAIIVLFSLSFATLQSTAQLSGNYTIDPSQPTAGTNFKYFGDALTALNTIGVNDTTVFNIASGVYDTLLTFSSAIPGMGPTAPITFQSATGNAADVILKHTGNSTANYVIDVNGAKFMSFRNMTIQALGPTYGTCVAIRNNSQNIFIDGNIITGPGTTSTSSNMSLLNNYSSSIDSNIIITNNKFINGSYGVYMYGVSSTSLENNNKIENNIFSGFYIAGIMSYYQKYININKNSLTTNSSYSSTIGVNLNYNDYSIITKNTISHPRYYGLSLSFCDGSSTNLSEVSNNFITIGGTSTAYALYIYSSQYANVFHNTIICAGTSENYGYALFNNAGNYFSFKNNIFANTGSGPAFMTSTANIISDYNNLFARGTYIGKYLSSLQTSLSDWISATNKDSNSVSVYPELFSADNCHTYCLNMDNLGVPLSVYTDIDGEMRSLTHPDMGADEYTPPLNNAGVFEISEPITLPHPLKDSVYITKIRIKNFGSDTISKVNIEWSVNNIIQPPFVWNGLLLPNEISDSVAIGNIIFSDTGSTIIKAWTSLPNDSSDGYLMNDSLSKAYYVCNLIFAGTYSINPGLPTSGSNFRYFDEVMDVLNSCGVIDTTVFNIASGIYDTLLTFPQTIPGMGGSAPITFQSASGNASDVILRHSAISTTDNYVIDINGAKYMTFQNMTIKSLGSSLGNCIVLRNGSSNILINNNIIEGMATTSMSYTMSLVCTDLSSFENNLTIKDNIIRNGSVGVILRGTDAFSKENNNSIVGNHISDYYVAGIRCEFENNLTIENNTLSTLSSYPSTIGIDFFDCDSTQIRKNFIHQPKYCGLMLYNCDGSIASPGEISNNFIIVDGTGAADGIHAENSNYQNVYHNSVCCTSTSTTSNFSLFYKNSNNFSIKNNIFANTGNGYAFYTTNENFTSDYNDFYAASSNLFVNNTTHITFTSLASWIATVLQDSNSVSMNPSFHSTTDLHTALSSMNNKGTPLGIHEDIDGDIRSLTTPDIGADEYTPPGEDAGIEDFAFSMNTAFPILDTLYTAKARLRNFGSDTLETVTIEWSINGIAQPPYAWTGALLPDSVSSEISIGTFSFPAADSNYIRLYTKLPNNLPDANYDNDTLQKSFFICRIILAGTYTINPGFSTGGGNFHGFADVMKTLNECGLSDTTMFVIASGIYDTLLNFSPSIPGLSPTTPISFQSASGNAADVTIRNTASSSSDNYVINVAGADYLSFRNITFQSMDPDYGTCINVENNSSNILLEGNIIKGSTTTTALNNAALLKINNSNNLTIRNNEFINGSFGIYMQGVSTYTNPYNCLIEENTVSNYYYKGIYSTYQSDIIIRKNTISTNSSYGTIGIELDENGPVTVTQNKIIQPRNRGLYIYFCDGNINSQGDISNNFIYVGGGSTTSCGVHINNSSYYNVYHNSINCMSSAVDGKAVHYDLSNNCKFKNNNIVNNGGGYAFYNQSNPASAFSDYNNLFTTGLNLTYYMGVNQTTLSEWTAASNQDQHSVSINPSYASTTDMHTNSLTINDAGTPVGIAVDFDGELRSLSTPDIGADEFTPSADNAGVVEISYPLIAPVPIAGTSYNVKVKIRNFGTSTLTNTNILWAVNGIIQAPYAWTGSLLPDEISSEIIIGSVTFTTTGNNEIKAWTTMPNNMTDVYNLDDTTKKQYYICSTALAGNYTINPAAPTAGTNFQYFADVLNMLNTCGVMDTTVFEIASGIYDTLLRFDDNIPGMNVAIPITFQSLSGNPDDVIIRNNENHNLTSKNYLIQLNSVNNMTFRNLTFNAENESYGNGRCIVFNGLNSNLLFEGNHFIGAIYLDIPEFSLVYSSGSTNNNTVFRNNIFEEGAYGVYMYGVSETNPGNGNIFDGNQFIGYDNKGLYLTYQNDLTISDNTFQLSFMDYYYPIGIDLNYCNNVNISMNKVQGKNCCLHLNNCSGDGLSPSMVMNNFFSVYGTYHDVAVNIENTSYFNFFHNSLNCVSSDTTSGVALNINLSSDIQFKNNIIANTAGGKSFNFYSDYSSLNSDYNNMYTTGPVLCSAAGLNLSTLNDWSAYSGGDTHSISSSPDFVSDIDLHCGDTASNNAGIYLGIAIDIDNELRNQLHPDLGADEFSIVNVFSTVYPGDISNDALVDGNDLLLLGLNYNVAGSPRDSVSIEWLPQNAFDWGTNMSGAALDMKFADCNGDGITLDSDTNAISQNFGLTHTFKTGITPDFPKATPTISLLFPDTLMVNTPTQIEVVLGDAANPFTNLHGINFDFSLNSNFHITNFTLTSLLAAPATQLKLLKNTGTNEYSLAFTKTDGNGFSGYGSAATITMVFDSIPGLPFNTTATVSNAVCLNADGTWNSPTGSAASFILASGTTVQINEPESNLNLNIHPNPASAQTEISFTLPAPGKCVLTLRNTLGELVQTTTIDGQSGKNSVNVDLSNLGQGIYVYTLEYKDVMLTRRLSVIK